jgi:hypothetical protein
VDPSVILQGAVVPRLRAAVPQVESRVHDHVPQSVNYPYLSFGETEVLTDDATCIEGVEIFFTVHVWSRAVGAVEARGLCAAVKAALHDFALPLAGFLLIELSHRSTRILGDPDGKTTHGVVQFRALIEKL